MNYDLVKPALYPYHEHSVLNLDPEIQTQVSSVAWLGRLKIFMSVLKGAFYLAL